MPTITFDINDLNKLVGKKLTKEKIQELLDYSKGEIEAVNGNEISVKSADTNLPYLWSVEGIAILFKGLLGLEKGLKQLKLEKTKDTVIVDKSVKDVRPCIAAFSVKGARVDEYLLKQIIQLQEKFCHSYGMKRLKVAVGVYNYNKIKFPVYYKAVLPESVQFMPLGFKREMTLGEIIESHPTGMEYAHLLKGFKSYPLLVDSNKQVLSFPPIINSEHSGKVLPGDSELFFEATGNDRGAVQLAANIFAFAFAERGFKIREVTIDYSGKKEQSPAFFNDSIKLKAEDANKLLGLNLKETEVKHLLEKFRYGYDKGKVLIPDYRRDIMHPVDVIEDIGIAYGYDKIPLRSMKEYTLGGTFPITKFVDKARELAVGMGYQEIYSPMLCNANLLYSQMNVEDFGTVEIETPMTELFSCVRTWILPQLMELLSSNKNAEYPQRIFEQGMVTMKKDLKDFERMAVVTAHTSASFTEIKQALDFIMNNLGVKYDIENTVHHSFIPGRVGRVVVNGKGVAYIGEMHPKVLANFGLSVPVSAFEMNLTDLFETIKK
ncbi:MAG: phenylalanine--tRNA ligase subunit beta [Candidatus Nanoarchaeia archaeon]|nr:phenylalanine--tRNA ligase subunit beta [Candidatus Nanoarchaeia archaeon]